MKLKQRVKLEGFFDDPVFGRIVDKTNDLYQIELDEPVISVYGHQISDLWVTEGDIEVMGE